MYRGFDIPGRSNVSEEFVSRTDRSIIRKPRSLGHAGRKMLLFTAAVRDDEARRRNRSTLTLASHEHPLDYYCERIAPLRNAWLSSTGNKGNSAYLNGPLLPE